ncbi:MAG: RAMP superfamily CRISPR-associated protein [Candidatus Cloacimonetes bacterium]|nr:RAMP superfamily CRISPR-associated protein [Candidatus Cloacimonadota bacterium]
MKSNNYEFLSENYDKAKIENYEDYLWFCKQETRLRNNEKKVQNQQNISDSIKYYNSNDFNALKNTQIKNVPIYYLKKCKNPKFETAEVASLSGLFSEVKRIEDYLKTLISFSFAVHTKFNLASPYYSADDDKYSIFDNPLLKEKVFKVPMMRGSSWKGVIASAARMALEQDFSLENILSFGRLFGSGSEEFREIEELAIKQDYDQKSKNKVLYYALMKFGKISMQAINKEQQKEELWKKIKAKELQTQRGRLVFYPSYFNQIGLEMINPHKRRTKAGTQPIYYEVVPAGAEAIFQLLYIPADNITKSDKVRKAECENDKKLLTAALQLIFQDEDNDKKPQIKIGAKTKLGWGRIEPLSEEKFNQMIVGAKDEQ